MNRFLFNVSICAYLLIPTLSADAQKSGTGPTKKFNQVSVSNSSPVMTQGLTSERVTQLLQAKGAQVTSSQSEIKGAKFTVLRAKMQADDFTYDVNIVFTTFANGTNTWYMSAPLNTNGVGLTFEKLQRLMKRNFDMAAMQTFMIDPQTGTVMIETTRFPINMSDQNFQNEMNIYLQNIKDTYKYWGASE